MLMYRDWNHFFNNTVKRKESHFKVEIAYNHLLNWACARGSLPNDYALKLLNVEEYCKANFLENNTVPDQIKHIFHKTNDEYTEWYDSLNQAFELLKNSDEGKKVNFIGQYTYEPLQKLNKVLKNFKKHNLHIVSYYQLLHKYVTYYVPYLKKNITRTTSELNDIKVKEVESTKKIKSLSTELKVKLNKYGLEVTNYPFKDEFQTVLFFDLQEKIVDESVKYMRETYENAVEILKELHEPLVTLLESFVRFQKMEEKYSVTESTKFLNHASKQGLEPFQNASNLHESIQSHNNSISTQTLQIHTATPILPKYSNITHNVNIGDEVIVIEEGVKLDPEVKSLLFDSFLGNNMCRKFLLSDLYELLIFVSLREDELKRASSMPSYNLLDNSDQPDHTLGISLRDYEQYKEKLNLVIELLSGPKTVNVQNLLKNQQKLSEKVYSEMSLWTQALIELTKQDSYQYQIKSLELNLKTLKSDLENVRKNVLNIKNKLEQETSSISKLQVHIFGEIDQI
ncbi:uncharacterized protein TA02830 [Theileria annulata]|uniref:Uncharacterized protein n=1 Tax=Theileria annulata TaxID=5874 RepID=Q4UHK8_THEAN|nr:uncharacterized protein TA02830 [Theileria annulata]CAI73431.1 hypothetical protein TA02830 [Theileria annulata]|eukprot:XP_954108.1 hypothetical protein TA02830 [Theileria annulata]